MIISGKSQSAVSGYSSHLAKIALYFDQIPTSVSIPEIDAYLYMLKTRYQTPSDSYFKFTVYGLRLAYRMEGLRDKYIEMPVIKHNKKLPIVLSREEMRRLLELPKSLKHDVLLKLLYGCGLRCFEVRNIRVADIDFDRKQLYVQEGKGKKDRYVPISEFVIPDIKEYLKLEKPGKWLFNGKPIGRKGGDFDSRYSSRGIQWVIKQVASKAEIIKDVTVHTLRHTFATHLLEDGLDIVSIKELLGHQKIETTMVYLHVARCGRGLAYSPLDTLYGLKEPEFKHGVCPYFIKHSQNITAE